MSFITPLLDTLLHEVLGKRMDPPARRELTEPVKPILPTEAAQAIHSDSRLDARRAPFPELAPPSLREGAVSQKGQTFDRGTGDETRSSLTRLSPTAEVIRTLLARHPAPASVLRSPAPLVAQPSPDEPRPSQPARQLAESLRASIRESGLFYESHLKAWYRGRLPPEALAREPQMRLQPNQLAISNPADASLRSAEQPLSPARSIAKTVPAASVDVPGTESGSESSPIGKARPDRAPAAAQSAPSHQGSAALPSQVAGKSSAPIAANVMGVSQEAHVLDADLPVQNEPNTPRVALESSEALQNIVRHQLELLTVPVLRWEGEVWQGLFMSLAIHAVLPPLEERPSEESREETSGESDTQEWQSEFRLELASMGPVDVSVRLQRQQLDISVRAESARALEHLNATRDALLQRLAAKGFAAPRLQLQTKEGQHGDEQQ